MQDKLEGLIKLAYRRWKLDQKEPGTPHPDEETLACLVEGRLTEEESEQVRSHIVSCQSCGELVAVQTKLLASEEKALPEESSEQSKDLLTEAGSPAHLEIFLRLKEKFLEIINTTGDVLVGQELVPAPVLRSRSIKDFKDEVTILKDLQDIRVEVKIENKKGTAFNLNVIVKQKQTQKILKDLRVTLIREDLELESYLADSGSVTFEHVLLGKYRIEISELENKLASILVDINT